MAITETVRNLAVNPSVTRTVTLDLQSIIPEDTEGDEIYVTSSVTTATSVIDASSINPIYLREFKTGYCKSSGFKNPPFNVTPTSSDLRISIDGSSFYTITLASGTGLSGEDVADDMQTKISALGGVGGVAEGDLAFLNALVEFSENRFKITSGTVSNTYTGVGKSSVSVIPGVSNDISAELGFNIVVESEALSSKKAKETILTTTYSGGIEINVESVDDYAAWDAFTITDGTNREYFVASGVDAGDTKLLVISGTIMNTYSGGAIVQKIFERDPTSDLASPYDNIDALIRFQLRSMANQMDFSS